MHACSAQYPRRGCLLPLKAESDPRHAGRRLLFRSTYIASFLSAIDSVKMFSKKMAKDEVGVPTQLKGSKQRALKDKVLETYPLIAPVIEAILPKKKK